MKNLRAIFIQQPSGEYKFVAAFANDDELWGSDVAENYCEGIKSEGRQLMINNFERLNQIPEIWIANDS